MVVVAKSEEFPAERIESLPIEGSVAGQTYRTGETCIVDDASTHPVANPQGPYESGRSGRPPSGHRTAAVAASMASSASFSVSMSTA
jgi:hypothetical protein